MTGASTAVTMNRHNRSSMGAQAGAPVSPTTQPATGYLHGDLIRSTVLVTNDSGVPASQPTPATGVAKFAYTAFGELVGNGPIGTPPEALATRYLYAGGWGYEAGHISLSGPNSDLGPIQLHHVGARWYQPDVGRFVQRDPIGVGGGINTFTYCDNTPPSETDPTGLTSGPPIFWWPYPGPPPPEIIAAGKELNKIGTKYGADVAREAAKALRRGVSLPKLLRLMSRYGRAGEQLITSILRSATPMCLLLAIPVAGGYIGEAAAGWFNPTHEGLIRGMPGLRKRMGQLGPNDTVGGSGYEF